MPPYVELSATEAAHGEFITLALIGADSYSLCYLSNISYGTLTYSLSST